MIFWGLGLQFGFAFLVLKNARSRECSKLIEHGVNRLLDYAAAGSKFVFGDKLGAQRPIRRHFAFQVLPIIIFIASCSRSCITWASCRCW